jgi:TPR repeat protein
MNLQALQQPLLDALADMRRRAEGGDREAAFDLSLRYIQGDGVPQDWAEATKWSRMAADKGHVQAQHNMGVLHERARITGTSDPVEAARWYRRAADQDYPLSQFNLAIMLLAPNTAQRNVPEALKLLEAAARQDPDAFITLGDIHDQGVDVPRDLARARSYYEASKSGDPRVAARLRELTPAFIERETIKEIQILLARLKYQVGTPDGRIGRRTTDAIKEFQRTAGVPDDGKVSSELLDLLRSVAPSSG